MSRFISSLSIRLSTGVVALLPLLAVDVALADEDGSSVNGAHLYNPLHNYNSDLCLGISGGTATPGEPAIQWTCNSTSKTQEWNMYDYSGVGETYTRLVNLQDRCLGVSGGSKEAGAQVIQWDCNGAASQEWYTRIVRQAPRVYEFVNKNSGMCLDVKGQSKSAGAVVIQWPCNGGANQQWFFTAAPLQ
jgi:hypothetical protein